jgi:hypothetical protein
MQNKLLILLFLPFLWAGDYVCFDDNGYIDEKYISVDGSNLDQRADCLKVTREVFEALTRWKKVSGGAVMDMTQAEIDAILAAEAQANTQAQTEQVNNIEVTLKEAFTAWLKVYNSKVPAQYRVTAQELINQLKADKGL